MAEWAVLTLVMIYLKAIPPLLDDEVKINGSNSDGYEFLNCGRTKVMEMQLL